MMQIFVKTLKGTHFDIKVNPDDTVADVKKNIESIQGQSVYPADQQMLIHQGKVLKDETTLAENNVAEKAFVVIMLRKGKGSSSGASTTTATPSSQPPLASSASAIPQAPSKDLPPAPSQAPIDTTPPTLGSTATNTTTEPALAPAPAPVPAPSPAITKANTANAYDQAASNLVAGSNLEQVIQQILDMGGGTWDRDSVIRAMRAAFNNPERAVEYLYSGIPEQADAPSVSQSHTAQAALVTNNPSAQAAQVTNNPSAQAAQMTNNPSAQAAQVTNNPSAQAAQVAQPAIPSSVPNANPLNLFPQGLPSLGTNPGAGNLHFLRNSPQFRALQAMVQANPQILQPMLQELSRQNPQIMRLIQEHQAEFLRLINESAEGGEGNALGQLAASMPQALTVTPEEREAIERLEAMGFNRALVLQVFFACNKNEELAANYLLDHMHEFDD